MRERIITIRFTCDAAYCGAEAHFETTLDARGAGWTLSRYGEFCDAVCREMAERERHAKLGAS